MSLLEVLIALTILVSILALSVSVVKKKDNNIKKTFRHLISLNRQLDHFARLKRQTYRLVIRLDKKKSSWWVEKKISENQILHNPSNKENQSFPPNGFIMDTDFFEKPQHLPNGLNFESVELNEHKDPITSGMAYIHYFPEGQFNLALVKVKSKKTYWSIFIDRLHGELTVFSGKKTLKEFEQ